MTIQRHLASALNPRVGNNLVEKYGPLGVVALWLIATALLFLAHLALLGVDVREAASEPGVVTLYGTLSAVAGFYLRGMSSEV